MSKTYSLLPTRLADRSGGEVFLLLMAFAVIVQLPGNTFLALLLPLAALLWNGIPSKPAPVTWPMVAMWAWVLVTLGLSLIAVIRYNTLLDRNYFIVMISVALTVYAVLADQSGRSARSLIAGVYAGFATLAAIGVVEVITGFKLLYLRYPDSTVASWAATYRWFTTAMYPNYNDFSVALVILGLFILARFLLKPLSRTRQLVRLGVLAGLLLWVLAMGSRGALFGFLAGAFVLVLLTQRRRDPRAIPAWVITTLLVTAVVGVLALAQSAYVQDDDTQARGGILNRLWALVSEDPMTALLGFASPEELTRRSEQLLEGELINPHNLLAETVLWGGFGALLAFGLAWLGIVIFAVRNRTDGTWYGMAATAATIAMPLLGLTPSVILHYMYPQMLMLMALVAQANWVKDADSSAAPEGGPMAEVAKTSRETGLS